MSLPLNSALYYPSIEFRDFRWLWTSALLWDKIYRIQPADFSPDEPDNVRALCEEGDVGIPLRPAAYAKEVAQEFMISVDTGKWNAAALEKRNVRNHVRIHHDKIDIQLREMLISKGRAASHEQWLYVPDDFEALYMTYLAKKMASKNGLQPVSDSNAAWTALTYFSTEGIETECLPKDMPFALAALMIGNFVPQNITDITPKALLAFRRRYPDERRNFMRAVKDAAKQLANCHDAKVVKEIVKEIQKDIERALKDLQGSMEALQAESFVGLKSLTLPMSSAVLGALLPLEFTQSVLLGATGLAVGSIASVATYKQKGKRLSKEHEFSYLMHAERAFPKTVEDMNVPRRLYRNMNEFIND